MQTGTLGFTELVSQVTALGLFPFKWFVGMQL